MGDFEPAADHPLRPRTSGEERAFAGALEGVIQRFRRMILHAGRRHGLRDDDVDEVLQEVRVRLWQAQKSPETIGAVGSSYVYHTAVSAAVDILRRRRATRTGAEKVHEVPANQPSVLPSPSANAEEHELEERIFAAVDGLIDTRRAVVRMYLAGYGRQEIAAALGWDETRVRNLLHRGLIDLRTRLTSLGIGPVEVSD
jgi:RNA polymerase sigma-70 factor (ECF subfamily)